MKKSLIALALVSAFAAPAFAEEAAPTPEHTLTGNVGLFSSYRFRGIDQTFGKPALQGGFDYTHSSGVYVGNWNSNVSSGAGFPDGFAVDEEPDDGAVAVLRLGVDQLEIQRLVDGFDGMEIIEVFAGEPVD